MNPAMAEIKWTAEAEQWFWSMGFEA